MVIVMVSNQTGVELGYLAGRYPGALGHLYSPGGQTGPYSFLPYAIDNGAWPAHKNGRAWSAEEWRELLTWTKRAAQWEGMPPLWALVPDVVGDRAATMERWREFHSEVRSAGFRPAFAAQDGMTFDDVPSSDCVVFLGGSTEWKEAAIDPWCRAFPGRVHVGRVNTWGRLVKCWRAGAISVDGTGWFRRGSKGQQSSQRKDLIKFLRETHGAGGVAA